VGPVGPVNPVLPVGPTLPVGPAVPVGPVEPVGPAVPVGPILPVGPVGPCLTKGAGAVHTNVAVFRLLTIEIQNQTVFVGLVGGAVVQPAGGVPTLVVKFHEPPVGVAGAVADS
jgi:hypothetical protein